MTPAERDKLATMTGALREEALGGQRFYVFPAHERIQLNEWRPEKSLGDCLPLFAEIKRRGLWEQFEENLAVICPPSKETAISTAEYMRYCYDVVTPADIVAAFIKTIEEADDD